MKQNKITGRSKVLLILSAVLMVIVIFVPLWKIDLVAPQYPEGLGLIIFPNGLHGNVDIINGLNHYIGMKHLHTEDFIEFTILPYIIGFFALLFLVVGLLGYKKGVYFATILFICFGIISMIDFWRWEYNYGHNLDPNAAIVVPGMAYQPPLIGFKQLLNFSAWSFPALGGWLFVTTGLIMLFTAVTEWRRSKKATKANPSVVAASALVFISLFSSCNAAGPVPLRVGKDACDFCKMTVSDARFGAEIVTSKGKIYKFDDTHCLLAFLKEAKEQEYKNSKIYFVNFSGDHSMILSDKAVLLKSDQLRSPMGGNIAAFDNRDSLGKVQAMSAGDVVLWNDVYVQ